MEGEPISTCNWGSPSLRPKKTIDKIFDKDPTNLKHNLNKYWIIPYVYDLIYKIYRGLSYGLLHHLSNILYFLSIYF